MNGNTAHPLNELGHDAIRVWLKKALHGAQSLPLLTRDEFPHLGILRLEKTLKPATRDSLREGTLQLVRQFCAAGEGDPRYLDELLALTAAFKNAEAVCLLADLALRFPKLPALAQETRWGVLAVLVDTPPSQTLDFWKAIGQQDSEQYASLVLSGVLALDPREAVQYLPKMPNTERSGQATALKLDLTWDELPSAQRAPFVEQITRILRQCSSPFAGPVQVWLASKPAPYPATLATNTTYPQLIAALSSFLGPSEVEPRYRTAKLCEAA